MSRTPSEAYANAAMPLPPTWGPGVGAYIAGTAGYRNAQIIVGVGGPSVTLRVGRIPVAMLARTQS